MDIILLKFRYCSRKYFEIIAKKLKRSITQNYKGFRKFAMPFKKEGQNNSKLNIQFRKICKTALPVMY